jgi:integral membrane sensor domain MASE1
VKLLAPRILASAVLAVLAWLVLAGANAPKAPIKEPDKLVILSTTDVKGWTTPCG